MVKNMQDLSVRIVRHSQSLDSTRRYLTDSPTPEGLAQTLKSIDDGDLAAAIELCEEMEGKDAHLQGVANTRRQALTCLPWEILPDPAADDQDEAGIVADYIRRQLARIKTWPATLEHLATAIGPGLAVTELVWAYGRLVKTVDVPGNRLTAHNTKNTGVYVLTDEEQTQGIEAVGPKWVVHTPHARSGYALRVTLLRATAWLWVLKHTCRADWAAFMEVFGQPVRIARYPAEMPADEVTMLENTLRDMGSDLWAIFPEGVELEFKEASRGNQPYEAAIDWLERKQSILWLGQTLTTEPGQVGSLALGRVHDNVRASLTLGDIAKEATVIREQVFEPMCRFRWPGARVPVPIFQRQAVEARDLAAEQLDLEKFRFMAERGLPVDSEVIYERMGIPPPKQPANVV